MDKLYQYIQDRIDALIADRELASGNKAKALDLAIGELKGVQEEIATEQALECLVWG